MNDASPAAEARQDTRLQARFVTGPIMNHVVVMTLTGAIGLMSMFFVDFADLFFLSLLGDTAITAAIGYAGTIAFCNLSVSLGLGIAAAALVSRYVGAQRIETARRFATNSLIVTLAVSIVMSVGVALWVTPLLRILGAHGEALAQARIFLLTLTPGFPLIAGAVTCSFILRAIGDPRRAMYVTLLAAIFIAVLDPIFIFGLGLGIQGAALATVLADLAALAIGLHGVHRVHRFLAPTDLVALKFDLKPIAHIALPAVMTQLATPFAVAYLTRTAAPFGDDTVAGVAIINRLIPVAFGIIFSLAGAVGPIIGQNYGAGEYDRVRRALTDGLVFASAYTLATSFILLLLRNEVALVFNASPGTAELVVFFCTFLAVSWAFTGAQFVAQAVFNNLGKPHWSTFFNWGRATIGTIPFVHIGAHLGGAKGLMIGSSLGSAVFGIAAVAAAYHLTARIARDSPAVRGP